MREKEGGEKRELVFLSGFFIFPPIHLVLTILRKE
jgi:hypothetical protein